MRRVRLDERMVELRLAETRSQAERLIRAGLVRVRGQRLDKPGTPVAPDATPELAARPRYVSRGGEKLAAALDAFGLDPRGARCLDAGASTGGFTHCLLERGAARVVALDVGYGQLAVRLRDDPRVEVRERTHVRDYALDPDAAGFDLITADLSFIGLRKVLPELAALARPGGVLVVLVKPQFELERGQVGKGGVVRDPALRDAAALRVAEAARALGLEVRGESESVLPGPRGNRERFLHLVKPAAPSCR
jgi:23S rRNA (cytidine1920-2'-O)/16S rRNA (cytidine1409-2'-O)-methyltransferase